MQDEEGLLGSVRWEEAGWIQTLVLLTQGAGCSLGLHAGVSCSSSPPHFIIWDPNPAEQTPSHSAGAAQKAPLAVPHYSAWYHREGIDCLSEAGDMECPKPCQGQCHLLCLRKRGPSGKGVLAPGCPCVPLQEGQGW